MNELLLSGATVIIGVTASIAAYKAAYLVSSLKKAAADVYTVMTPDAVHFVAPLTYQALSGNPVFIDMFRRDNRYNPRHIALAERADLIAIVPATADFIGKLAAGRGDDLLSAVVMAYPGPVLIAPAMNSAMYENPIVRLNIEKLKRHDYKFIGPASGDLACGEKGAGRMSDPSDILAGIKAVLSSGPKPKSGFRSPRPDPV